MLSGGTEGEKDIRAERRVESAIGSEKEGQGEEEVEDEVDSRAKVTSLSVLSSGNGVLVPSLDDLPVEESGGDRRKSSDSSLKKGRRGKEREGRGVSFV